MYPGDPNGSASNVIRCECTMLPGLPEDERGTWRDERDAEIRASYPALRDATSQPEAMATLADRHALSEGQVKRIIYSKTRA